MAGRAEQASAKRALSSPSGAARDRSARTGSAPSRRSISVALAVASAAAASAHELAWGRLLGRAVGNTSLGLGLTLCVLMLGMGGGALLASRLASSRAVRSYVVAEVVIALGAIGALLYCLGAPAPSAVLSLGGEGGLALDVVAASAVTLAPAVAMGATFPLLLACSPSVAVTDLYAAGLAGAVVGASAVALLVAPHAGLDSATALAAAINLFVALTARQLLRSPTAESAPSRDAPADRAATARFGAAGALGLGAQVIWNRCLVPYAGVSLLTFAAIVGAYVLAQAAGFAVHSRLAPSRREVAAPLALALAGPVAILSFALMPLLAPMLGDRDASPAAWVVAVIAIVLAIVGPTAMLLGVSQADALASCDHRDDRSAAAGRIGGVGTMLSAAGALVTSVATLPILGPRWALAALSLVAGAALLGPSRSWRWAATAAAAGACAAAWGPGPAWFLGTAFDDAPRLYAEHGIQDTTGVVMVDRPVEPGIRRLVANGVSYSGDSIFAQRYMRLLAHLPALAARDEGRALVICVGTGTTLDALRAYRFDAIDAIDISPSIRATLALFEHVSEGAIRDPRVHLSIDDGARFLRRTRERYDVITLEPPPPRAPGGSALYSWELYETARAHLREGGAVAQWLPLHGMSSVEARSIIATFVALFPDATLHLVERNEAILVGTIAAARPSREDRLARSEVTTDLRRIGLDDRDPYDDTLVAERAALEAIASGAPWIRDAWPLPEYAPLGGTSASSSPLDELVAEVAQRSSARPGSSAAILITFAPAFIRLQEGDARAEDRSLGERGMRAWLARDPQDPYVQYALGFGPLLESRLQRLGDIDPEVRAAASARIAAQRRAFTSE
jgi:spermidine synthase